MKRGRKQSLTRLKKITISYYKLRGKTQNWIARKTKISISTVNHYINGNYPYRKRG